MFFCKRFPMTDGLQTLPLKSRVVIQPCGVTEGWSKVDQFGQTIVSDTCCESVGPVKYERHPQGFLIKMRPFEINAMIAQHFAVVRHENEQSAR